MAVQATPPKSKRKTALLISVLPFGERAFNTNLPNVRDAKQEGIVLWQRKGWSVSIEEEEHPADPYNPQIWLEMAKAKIAKMKELVEGKQEEK